MADALHTVIEADRAVYARHVVKRSRGRKTAVIERALDALEDQAGRDGAERAAVRASLARYAKAGLHLCASDWRT